MTFIKIVVSLALSLICHCASAQYALDSLFSMDNAEEWYDQQVGLQNTVLQHGELELQSRKSRTSHAYFEAETWRDIRISYCHQTFENIPALYNIEEDVLIVKNNLGPSFATFPIKLRKELVSCFEIGSARFEYIDEPVGWHEKGFFKVSYRGDSLLLLDKVFKRIQVHEGSLRYTQDHHYFLKKEGHYHRLKRLSTLIKLFPEHKKEIRQYKRRLSLRKLDNPANEEKLARLIRYCDSLSKK